MSKSQLRLDGEGDAAHRMALGQFDTPPALAARQVAMVREGLGFFDAEPRTFLEPSAGTGVLVRALFAAFPRADVHAIELDPARASKLPEAAPLGSRFIVNHARGGGLDYLEAPSPPRRYDVAISNPPFTNGAEREHLVKMMRESERVIVQLPIRAMHGQARYRDVWSRIGRDFFVRREVRVAPRVYPNASDDLILLDLRRESGPCSVAWWSP